MIHWLQSSAFAILQHLYSQANLFYSVSEATHHYMDGPSPMDFIYDIERASSAICNGTSSLTGWLEIPNGSAKSWVFDDFRSSERHLPK